MYPSIRKKVAKVFKSELVSHTSAKFMPNLAQLNAALHDLPDPETCSELRFKCPLKINKQIKHIEFKRIRVRRGSKRPYRWIYQGKILIRNQDI